MLAGYLIGAPNVAALPTASGTDPAPRLPRPNAGRAFARTNQGTPPEAWRRLSQGYTTSRPLALSPRAAGFDTPIILGGRLLLSHRHRRAFERYRWSGIGKTGRGRAQPFFPTCKRPAPSACKVLVRSSPPPPQEHPRIRLTVRLASPSAHMWIQRNQAAQHGHGFHLNAQGEQNGNEVSDLDPVNFLRPGWRRRTSGSVAMAMATRSCTLWASSLRSRVSVEIKQGQLPQARLPIS